MELGEREINRMKESKGSKEESRREAKKVN
jgi:hypothetical protein